MKINFFRILSVISLLASSLFSVTTLAKTPIYDITIENHVFTPETLKIPADTKVKLNIINKDKTPEEFESHDFHREKIIKGGSTGTVLVGPLKPGTYNYFGEFNPKTAKGKIIVE